MGVMEKEKGSCPRCHGFMVPVILEGSETVVLDRRERPGRRCINCGECIDPLILANRRDAEPRVRIHHMHHNQGGHHG